MRVFRWLTVLCLLGLSMAFSASAATHPLPDIGITVESPADWEAYSRDELESGQHPLSDELAQLYLDSMLLEDAYMILFSPNGIDEIELDAAPSVDAELNSLDERERDILKTEFVNAFSQLGFECLDACYYEHTQVPFLYLEYVADGYHIIMLYTTYERMDYFVYYFGHDEPITDAQKATLLGFVDSITFHGEGTGGPAGPIAFADRETGLSFTVPAGATQTDSPFEYGELTVQSTLFVSGSPFADRLLLYYSMDFYGLGLEGMSHSKPRTAYTMDTLPVEEDKDFALGLTEVMMESNGILQRDTDWETRRVTYGGTEFMRTDGTITVTTEDISMTVHCAFFIHIIDGWAYNFIFLSYDEGGAAHPDIDAIMNTVAFSSAIESSDDLPYGGVELTGPEKVGAALGVLFVLLVVVVAPIAVIAFVISAIADGVGKRPLPPPKAPQSCFIMKAYRAEQMRATEQRAVAQGVSLAALMDHAGEALAEKARTMIDPLQGFLIICGRGNNGGDGYVCAARLLEAGYPVTVYGLTRGQLGPLANNAALQYEALGGEVLPLVPEVMFLPDAGLLIDAFLGTGLTRPVTGLHAHVVALMNAHEAPVLSCDLPSGLDADSGAVMGAAVRATETLMLGLYKLAVNIPEAMPYLGNISLADIGIPPSANPSF